MDFKSQIVSQRHSDREPAEDIEEELVDQIEEQKLNSHMNEQRLTQISYDKFGASFENYNLLSGSQISPAALTQLNEDVNKFNQLLVAEKTCPDILPFEEKLYTDTLDLVDNQEGFLKEIQPTVENKVFLNIYTLEIERMKYTLKSYLRIRLFKVSKYCTYIIRNKLFARLSKEEKDFVLKYYNLKQDMNKESVVNHLPSSFKDTGLNPKAEIMCREKLVLEPDLDKYVFFRVIKAFSKFSFPGSDKEVDLIPDEKFLAKYRDIKELYQKQYVELI